MSDIKDKTQERDPRYPIGRFARTSVSTPDDLKAAVRDLAEMPEQIRNAIDGLSDEQVATPYRDGGWTVRQLVHHIADSHMQAFTRVRLALTEDNPTITPYDENAWALMYDSLAAPVEWSLELIESLHARWVMMLQSLETAQWQRAFVHPERGPQTVELATLLYAWHSKHHVAHITHLRAEKGW
jgi:uncharacterized damage-inducible protein DinB